MFDIANVGRLADLDFDMNIIGKYSVVMGWINFLDG